MRLWDPDLYTRTLHFAAEAHAEQKIPGTSIPYVVHLAKVCQEALSALLTDQSLNGNLVMQCALLHDTIEDTHVTIEELKEHFGVEVAQGVDALSKRDISPQGKAWDASQKMRESIERIRREPREVWVVKLADRISNLYEPPTHWPGHKVRAYHSQAIEIRDALGEANAHLSARLTEKITNYPLPERAD